ncbi:MAG: restriction endonuclease subunit S [Bryobacteraceae bacterium]
MNIRKIPLSEALVEISSGVGPTWSDYRVLGATRAGLALAKEPVGKAPERYKLVEPGTIFYNPMRIMIGSIAMVDDGEEPGITSPDYVVFRPRPGVLHHRWFYYWLRSKYGEDLIRSLARGAVRERLLFKRLARGVIAAPDLAAQEFAASSLRLVGAARRAAQQAQSAASQLIIEYLNEAFNGEAPRWQLKRIAEIAETCSGSTPSRSRLEFYGGSIAWIKTAELRDGPIDAAEEYVTQEALKKCSIRLLPRGTLLVAMYGQGQTRGRTGLLRIPATTNQACFAILPNPSVFISEFLQLWFRANYHRLRRETEGRGGNQPNLNGVFLRGQKVALPPLEEQCRIVETLSRKLSIVAQIGTAISSQTEAINASCAALVGNGNGDRS